MGMLMLVLLERGGRLVKWAVGRTCLKHWVGLVNSWRRVDGESGHGRRIGMLGVTDTVAGVAKVGSLRCGSELKVIWL